MRIMRKKTSFRVNLHIFVGQLLQVQRLSLLAIIVMLLARTTETTFFLWLFIITGGAVPPDPGIKGGGRPPTVSNMTPFRLRGRI